MRILASMGGEAAEEIVSGVVDLALESIYNGKNVCGNYSADTAADVLHDAIIGGLFGLFGGMGRAGQSAVNKTHSITTSARTQIAKSNSPLRNGNIEGTMKQINEIGGVSSGSQQGEIGRDQQGTRRDITQDERSEVSGAVREGIRKDIWLSPQAKNEVNFRALKYGTSATFDSAKTWTHGEPAYTDKSGNVHIRDDATPERVIEYLEHELNHTMKRKRYLPYLDFVQRVPEHIDFTSDAGNDLLAKVAEHRGIDLTKPLTEKDIVTISDEIASLVRGAEMSGHVEDILGDLRAAFFDYDSFAAELDALHRAYQRSVAEVAAQGEEGGLLPSMSGVEQIRQTPRDGLIAYADALQQLMDEGKVLTPEQRAILEEWNRRFPEMRMDDDEFLLKEETFPLRLKAEGGYDFDIQYALEGELPTFIPFDYKVHDRSKQDAIQRFAISEDEAEFLDRYVAGIAYELTRLQRDTPESEWPEYDKAAIDSIFNALNKFPTYKGRTYRNLQFGIPGEPINAYEIFLSEYAEGKIVVLKAFSSASKDPNGYPTYGQTVHLVIDGISARDIADSFGIPSQQEVIYLPGTQLKIKRVATANDGKPLIFAEEIVKDDLEGNFTNQKSQTISGGTGQVSREERDDLFPVYGDGGMAGDGAPVGLGAFGESRLFSERDSRGTRRQEAVRRTDLARRDIYLRTPVDPSVESYADALRQLIAEGKVLSPKQRAILEEWNRRFPEMRMDDDELLKR